MGSKTVVFDCYGDADVLRVVDVAPPEPGPGQIRVSVRAAGVQPFDALFRSGAAHQWMPARFPQRLGNDFAGVVDAVGPGVTAVAVDDHVLGWAMLSSYGEHVVVDADDVVTKPEAMPWTEAGVLSASGQTAATALSELNVGAADTLLIHAAAGGVGAFAVQIARARGATVIGTASEPNHDYLRSLGASPVVYGDGLVERVRAAAPRGVTVALDAAGTVEALRASLELLDGPERIGTVAFQPAAAELGIRRLRTTRSSSQLAELVELYQAGRLHVTVSRAYPLDQAAQAHRAIETGHTRGKIALTP